MATQILPVRSPTASLPELSGGIRYLARQPIMDLRGRVHGYELLFRAGPEAFFCGDGNMATCTMLDNTVVFGLEQLTGGLPAFVNCTSESLTAGLVKVLPPSSTVLEVLESLEPTEELITTCKDLKLKGFRIAMDDFVWQPQFVPLVELADYIKVDFLALDAKARQLQLQKLQGGKAILLAEKIETQEDYQQACTEGFTLFQGYYFCRPILLKNRTVPSNCMLHMEILQQLQCEPLVLRQVGRLVKRDPSLAHRLLRLANSPISAIRQEVRSIEAAVVMMGEDMLRRVLTLAIASEWNAGRPPAILHMVFVRGRFCELASALCMLHPAEQYLLGMLSLLPAMMCLPMEKLIPSLPLREEIRQALQGTTNRERSLLEWLECHERGDWASCDAILQKYMLNADEVLRCYTEAVVWAEEALKSAV
jgi:EAL and modified HD-GYP domain-containing signal transduction protein